jgi:hypothetical protein
MSISARVIAPSSGGNSASVMLAAPSFMIFLEHVLGRPGDDCLVKLQRGGTSQYMIRRFGMPEGGRLLSFHVA